MTTVSIMILGLEIEAHGEQEPKLSGSTSVMIILIHMGTTRISVCKRPT